jgi:hypothetical protein
MGGFKEEITQEDFDLEEGKMKTIATMFSQGKSAEEIAKAMKLSVDTVKTILGEVKEELEESAAASEIQKNNTRRDSMDYNMYKKTVELLKKKDYKALGKHIYDAETAPREYVMGVIAKKEPQAFKKMFGNQTGYYSLMKPLKMSEQLSMKATFKNGDDKTFKGKTASDINKQVKEYEKKHNTGLQHDGPMVKEDLEEKIQPFMISYSKYGKHAGFEDAKSLQDLQTKAQKLRAKGFTIDKMGRYNPPVRKEDKDAFDPITEACWTGYKQVGMKDKGGKKVPNCVPEEFKVEDYIVEEINEEDKKKMKKADIAPDGDAEHAETTDEKKSDDKEKLKAEIEKKDDEIQKLKVKAETEKAKVAKKETEKMVNPETGEPLLQVGIAYKHLRDKMKKEEVKEATKDDKSFKRHMDFLNKQKKDFEKKEKERKAKEKLKKEDADYLKPRLNPQQIANIKKVFMKKKASDITPSVKAMIKKMDIPTQLAIKQADIPHISKLIEDLNQDDEKVIKKVKDMLKGASAKHAAQAKMIDKALKNEADLTKSQIKKVHDKADDLPKKSFRDRYGKDKGDSVRYGVATKMVKKKLNIENKDHPAKDLYEQIKGLKNKAEKSGMPYSILKKVYDRGMAAWRGGHRPGTTQQQWAFARVNSFVTKSSGTWGGADKDLAKQVRGSK